MILKYLKWINKIMKVTVICLPEYKFQHTSSSILPKKLGSLYTFALSETTKFLPAAAIPELYGRYR